MDIAPLPDHLVRGTHAPPDLRAAGVTRSEMVGPLWRRATHGRYAWGPEPADDVLRRIEEAASVLPEDGALGGWAAAARLGADLDGRTGGGHAKPVPFALQPHTQVRRGPQFRSRRSELAPGDVEVVDGIRVTSPLRTAFDLARFGEPEEGLVGVDAMLRAGLVDLAALTRYVARHPRWKGVPQARTVVGMADPGTRSCAESRFRYVWLVDAALPRPRVNVPVFSATTGRLLGLPDLLDEETGLVGEYDGAHHRELDQHAADNVREEAMERAGLTVVRATSLDLRPARRPALAARLRAGRLLARAHPSSAREWSLTPRAGCSRHAGPGAPGPGVS
jgi:hypothetical protein